MGIDDLVDESRTKAALDAEQFRMALDVGQAATFVWEVKTNLLHWSDNHFEIFGYEKTFQPDRSAWRDRVHPDDMPVIDRLYETRLLEEREIRVEYRIVLPDGTMKWIENRTRCDLNADGSLARVYGVTFDITDRKITERELKVREQRLKLALDAGQMAAFDFNIQNDEMFWSDEFFAMYGYTERFEPSPKHWWERVHPDDRGIIKELNIRTQTGRDKIQVQFRIVWPDGSIHWIEKRARCEFDEEGKPSRIFGVDANIDERKHAEAAIQESEERFRRIADDSPVMLWMCDADNRDVYFNRGWHEFTGTKPGDTFDSGWGNIVHPDDRYTVLESFRSTAARHEIWRKEYRLRRADGEFRWILDHGLPRVSDAGEFLGYIGSIIEIHDGKAAQAELERHVAQRTEELLAANKELEGFTYTVAHDLRAPLRAITSNSRILLEDYEADLPDDAKMLLGRQASAATRMGVLIDDLLEFSRIGRSELKRTTCDLVTIARHALVDAKAETNVDNVEFHAPASIEVDADAQLMQLVLFNLFSNALKFRKPDSVPSVWLTESPEGDHRVFSVRDNGFGFEQAYAEKVFLPFERLVRNDDYPGTGIGLANVARIIKRHGGTVRAEGVLGEGATFSFTLG